jgi:hypothetical protein
MERSEFARKIRAAWSFLKDRVKLVRTVSSLAPLAVDEVFRRLVLDPDASYRAIYLLGLSRSHYNLLLSDYAYLQFSWASPASWRLAYYPNPWITGVASAEEAVGSWEEFEQHGLLANEDVDELIADLPYLASVPPIRFEYSVDQYREIDHPAAHMHIGRHAENRWPFARLLDPLTFSMVIVKLYYPALWNPQSRFVDDTVKNCLEAALVEALRTPGRVHQFSETERRTIHFTAS